MKKQNSTGTSNLLKEMNMSYFDTTGQNIKKLKAKYSDDDLFEMACAEWNTREPESPCSLHQAALDADDKIVEDAIYLHLKRQDEILAEGVDYDDDETPEEAREPWKESDYFPKSQILNAGLTNWVNGLPNKVKGEGKADTRPPLQKALLDSRDRTVAVQIKDGFAVPDPKILTDDQIAYILTELPGKVEVKGSPDFCNRVETVGKRDDVEVDVVHEYQVSDRERQEAATRYEEQQRNEQQQQPGFRPA